ncbi:MAG: hypothetical protein RXR43_13280 [Sulfolobus sp.]
MIIDIASRKEDISSTLLEPIFCANKLRGKESGPGSDEVYSLHKVVL